MKKLCALLLFVGCGQESLTTTTSTTISMSTSSSATTTTAGTTASSTGMTTTTATTTATTTTTVDAPMLVVNEVMTRNDSTVMEPPAEVGEEGDTVLETLPEPSEGGGPFADWIEIYNPTDEAVALNRMTLSDGGAVPWNGGDGELASGEHLLLWADGLGTGLHLPFQLSKEGETVELSVDGVLVDAFEVPEIEPDTSWGRYPDGVDTFAKSIWPTPGWTNGSGPGEGIGPADAIFQTDSVNDLWIWVSDEGMTSLGGDPYGEVTASLAYGSVYFPAVGVRLKGVYGSLRSLDQKAAFKVDLNAYEDRAIRGLKSLSINNMVQDYSYTHEYLTYTFFRELGMPAPRAGYTRLYVNDEYYGLYLWLESVEKQFLKQWYEDPSGALFEGAYGVDFYEGWEYYFEYDEGPEPADYSDLTELASQLSVSPYAPGAYDDLKLLVDMDQFLRVQAAEALLNHWDGYTTANNYRVYHDPITDKFQMIPWGTDQTWVDVWYGPYDGYGILYTWCEQNSACLTDYRLALEEVADALEGMPLEDTLDDIAAWLNPYIQSDPRKEFGMSTHYSEVSETRTQMLASPDRIRGYL